MQLTVVAKIKAQKGKEIATQEALEALIPITLKEEGCINYDLHITTEDKGTFLFYENWESKELWQQHMENQHLKDFLSKAEELLDGAVDLSLWHIKK